MKEITLNKGFVSIVDDEDYDHLMKWEYRWFVHKDSSCDSLYYVVSYIKNEQGKRKHISMHRIIMNALDGTEIDHIDHNGLNNQKSNLRFCTHGQNCMNRSYEGSSKYNGVCYRKSSNKYVAQIKVKGVKIGLGYFDLDKEEDAARAYDEAAKRYHGEFANLNFKDSA